MANWLESIRKRERVLIFVGEVEHGRSEDRPVAVEQHSAGQPELLFVAKVLDGRVDVPVESQIADLRIGLFTADGEIDFIAADREIVLVEAVPVGDVDEAAIADPGSSHDIRNTPGKTGS